MKKILRLILMVVIIIDIMVGIWYLYNYFANRVYGGDDIYYKDSIRSDCFL